ncbi:hypothetical protein CSUNSWCD_1269 [Campylobacter showae CSUNSWCD]|uniref:Uncharacterized protein n=1 Tax=Campylobacter showae CSUNSWCD TaxID=1244083 RepID=M5ILB1_9BACT|nr:hypothetical protein CSUNSWCD_1269 [Campylobacter showae CSUNSWCD]
MTLWARLNLNAKFRAARDLRLVSASRTTNIITTKTRRKNEI